MALKKDFQMFDGINDNGVIGNYIKFQSIESPTFSREIGWSNGKIRFSIYLNQEARLANKQPIRELVIEKDYTFFSGYELMNEEATSSGIYMRKGELTGLEDAEDIVE